MFRRKSGVDMVDFTKTKHGKKIAEPKEEASTPIVGGFLDFTSPAPQSSSTETQIDAPSNFGFLSDFSQSAASSSSSASSPDSSSDVNSLRIKVEDLEFKIERLLERLAEIETKFNRA